MLCNELKCCSYQIIPSHRNIEWFGLESTLKSMQFHLPVLGRDTSH